MNINKFKKIYEKEVASNYKNLTGILDKKTKWYGEDGNDKSSTYEDFTENIFSLRATFVIINTYGKKHNIFDIANIFSRYRYGKRYGSLNEAEKANINQYINYFNGMPHAIKNYTFSWDGEIFVNSYENSMNLLNLVYTIVIIETGIATLKSMGIYDKLKQLVVDAFKFDTKDTNSPPAYSKFNIDINEDVYKNAEDEFLGVKRKTKKDNKHKDFLDGSDKPNVEKKDDKHKEFLDQF